MSINSVSISGNLTRDPELRQTQGGNSILNFSIAVNDRRQDRQTGEWEDYPNYVDCVMFGARAGAVARYLQKGSKVAVQGKLRYSSWEKDGQRRSKLEVAVDELEFMSRNQQQPMQQPQPEYMQPGYSTPAPQSVVEQVRGQQATVYDQDIPF